jgi:K+-sensing histidine kinase KdpD
MTGDTGRDGRTRPQGIRTWLAIGLGLAAPLAVAALWIPVRTHLPDTDLALLLVLVVLAVGWSGRWSAVLLAGASAAFWFEFLDTRPFEDLAIQRTPDLETTLTLALVSIVGGGITVRVVRQRAAARTDAARAASIRRTASHLATGEELVRVVQDVAEELRTLFGLVECFFEAAAADPQRAQLERSGELVLPDGAGTTPSWRAWEVSELPVLGHQQVFGHFVLRFEAGAERPSRDNLLAALTLGDQVGAAFMAQAPYPPDLPGAPHLRVVP